MTKFKITTGESPIPQKRKPQGKYGEIYDKLDSTTDWVKVEPLTITDIAHIRRLLRRHVINERWKSTETQQEAISTTHFRLWVRATPNQEQS